MTIIHQILPYWVLFLVSSSLQSCAVEAQPDRKSIDPTKSYPVLVELFTSQGCSSCPPADALLKELHQATQAGESEVIALSYHVDYWNRLGWNDPYSQAAFSERQRAYASRLDGRVYTPQMIVQGQTGHVGSRSKEVRQAIQLATHEAPVVNFTTHVQVEKDKALLSYKMEGGQDGTIVHLALVESEIANRVPRGENRGRTLHHTQVVRELRSLTIPTATAELSETIDKSMFTNPAHAQAILFAQNATTWKVLGVQAIDWVW